MVRLAMAALVPIAAAAFAAVVSTGAAAQDESAGTPAAGPPAQYSLFDPTPADKLRSLCTDRPTKSTGPCTVDPGHFQIESDLFNATFDRTGGVDTNTYLFTNPTLKLGVTRTLDLEANLAPAITVTTRDRATGARTSVTGIGDLFLRAKLNLIGDDGGAVAVALVPYVKIPTARAGIGNGQVEEGVLAPISVSLPAKWSLSLTPEFDWLLDRSGAGRHANLINLIGLSHPVGAFTPAVELWTDSNFDPAGRLTQYSFDLGLAWIPPKQPNFQLDGGINLGLNKVTPATQVYIGASRRF